MESGYVKIGMNPTTFARLINTNDQILINVQSTSPKPNLLGASKDFRLDEISDYMMALMKETTEWKPRQNWIR